MNIVAFREDPKESIVKKIREFSSVHPGNVGIVKNSKTVRRKFSEKRIENCVWAGGGIATRLDNIQEFFKALEKQFGLQAGFYVGLTDTETEGSFKWEKSGTYYSKMPQAMSLWKRGEPNNIGLNEHCVVVTPLNNQNKRSLNDVRCTIDHFVICQKNSY